MDNVLSDRVQRDKYAFYCAVNAIVAAIFENKEGVKESMKGLWESLFPEAAQENEQKAKKAADYLEKLPPVLYAHKSESVTQPVASQGDAPKSKPGIEFGIRKPKKN